MKISTKDNILQTSKRIFAINGYEGFSIRTLSHESGVGLSSIYHFFKDKDEILLELFNKTNAELGQARQRLPKSTNASDMLYGRVMFQFEQIENIVFVLKYYLHFRPNFLKIDSGYLPTKGYLHIEEVINFGIEHGDFSFKKTEVEKQSKVIAHAINGFLLEYFPNTPNKKELLEVVDSIHEFLMRSLTNKEAVVK